MQALASLAAVSFITSAITAAVGIGGGLGLLSMMSSFVPVSAVVPLHGVTQLFSNASRFLLDWRQAETRLLPAYLAGACLGGALGYQFIGQIPDLYLSAVLGGFILLCTWTDLVKRMGRIVTSFFFLAFIQTFLSLFVASVGLISQPMLIRQGLSKDKVIITHAMQMSVLHGLKVLVFVAVGFPFHRYWPTLLAMMAGSALGSYCGGFIRNRISEATGTTVLKIGITFFALKMIVDVAATSIGIQY